MYKLTSAQHVGRSHLLLARNYQDALAVVDTPDCQIGVICDGCSEGAHSEAGATLGAALIASRLAWHRSSFPTIDKTLDFVALRLLDHWKDLLASYCFSPRQHVQFIQDHLLFTVVGFIATPQRVTVFHAGDGVYVVNEQVTLLDEMNAPHYLAYHLIPHAVERELPPFGFSIESWTTAEVERLMIGSDAWVDEPDLLPGVWQQPHLQRCLNVWSDKEHRFFDDVSVITLERQV